MTCDTDLFDSGEKFFADVNLKKNQCDTIFLSLPRVRINEA
jgi:hypothetical protein